MTYLVHINPTPGSDLRVVEVEGEGLSCVDGCLFITNLKDSPMSKLASGINPLDCLAAFSPAVWNYVEPKK